MDIRNPNKRRKNGAVFPGISGIGKTKNKLLGYMLGNKTNERYQ